MIKVNSACCMGLNPSLLVVLYIRATNETLIGLQKDYDNKGNYSGTPLVTIRPKENINPSHLFNMLSGNHKFTDILTGVITWETREEWLSYFTPEERRTAIEIESFVDFSITFESIKKQVYETNVQSQNLAG